MMDAKFQELVDDSEILIIVPPFYLVNLPYLAAHILKARAEAEGFAVSIFYANIAFAKWIGVDDYAKFIYASPPEMLGERIFSNTAFGIDNGFRRSEDFNDRYIHERDYKSKSTTYAKSSFNEISNLFKRVQGLTDPYIQFYVDRIREMNFKIVGCSSTFEQTASSISFLKRMKQLDPGCLTLIGGDNCTADMAQGIASLSSDIDYIFSGESEITFVNFLKDLYSDKQPDEKIIQEIRLNALEENPIFDYNVYYKQLDYYFPDNTFDVRLTCETSRGCRWGYKRPCKFCGLNGPSRKLRLKSEKRVKEELENLLGKHSNAKIMMTDNCIPLNLVKTVLPEIKSNYPKFNVFYEVRSNLTLDQVHRMHNAGIKAIQPGIESLSTDLLKMMDKGVLSRHNINLLRYTTSLGFEEVSWGILYGFPGEKRTAYDEMTALIPLLEHLFPPTYISYITIDRFCEYYRNAEKYGIKNLRPVDIYYDVLPEFADIEKLSRHFMGDYETCIRNETSVIKNLYKAVDNWCHAWENKSNSVPKLNISRVDDESYYLIDSRTIKIGKGIHLLDKKQAAMLLFGWPIQRRRYAEKDVQWAMANKFLVSLDNWYIPLATAPYEIMEGLKSESPAYA